jgi:hypothetical protein
MVPMLTLLPLRADRTDPMNVSMRAVSDNPPYIRMAGDAERLTQLFWCALPKKQQKVLVFLREYVRCVRRHPDYQAGSWWI